MVREVSGPVLRTIGNTAAATAGILCCPARDRTVTTALAWRLEIHHFDVRSSGDATLVIAREVPPLAGAVPVVRSALIDGGRFGYAPILHANIVAALGANPLNVMIATHYDADHLNGLTRLLRMPGPYDNVRIFDQGWPAAAPDGNLTNYLKAINGLTAAGGAVAALAGVPLARVRRTHTVLSDGGLPLGVPAALAIIGLPAVPPVAAIATAADWLLTPGAPADILWDGYPAAIPVGAPTMECIAVNKFVRVFGGGIGGPFAGGMAADPKNEKSLAFEVRFGNFRYYVGGDIEAVQEAQIQLFLNNADNAAGRLLAMKASHHGANTATDRAFVDQVRPDAVLISCGRHNAYFHPAQETVNVLDGFPALPAVPHPAVPPAVPPDRPVPYYLTGYQVSLPAPQSLGGDVSVTAGDPLAMPVEYGSISLTVTAAESAADVRGGLYLGVRAAALQAATTPGAFGPMAGGPAGLAADAAAEAAVSSGAGPAAAAFLTAAAAAGLAAAATVAANGAVIVPGTTPAQVANTVRLAVLAAGPAIAAGAGAAAGAAFGNGSNFAIATSVAWVLLQAGLGAGPALAAGGGAVAAAAIAPSQFRLTLHDRNAPVNPSTFVHF